MMMGLEGKQSQSLPTRSSVGKPAVLELEQLSTGELDGVSLEVTAGQIIALSGPSGSGKTRLLRAIADLDPSEGEVRLHGASRAEFSAPDWRRKVQWVASESGWWADRVEAHFTDAADPGRVGLPRDVMEWSVERLSAGEKARLALLRSLSLQPDVLLLDEPTAHLDTDATTQVEELIARYVRQHRAAALWVSHIDAQRVRITDSQWKIQGRELVKPGCPQGVHS